MFNQKEYQKQYREDNLEKIRENKKQWKKNNPDKVREQKRRYCEKNPEKNKEYNKQWRKENPEMIKKYKAIKNKQERNRRRTDLKFNLNRKIVTGVWKSLNGNKNGRSWEDIVGYSCIELIKRLKKTIPEGYMWEDFLKGRLHIDHIIPKKVFNFSRPEHPDFKRCWALKNLRLLPAKENLKKGCKLSKPFQPALIISNKI